MKMRLTFRTTSPHPSDFGKARVRIGEEYMKRLGVAPGETIQVTGIRTTAATCFPLDREPLPHDSEFEFLDDLGTRFPVVRLSDIVSRNALGNNPLPIVKIEKSCATNSKLITLSPKSPIPHNKCPLRLKDMVGTTVLAGDCIRVAHEDLEDAFSEFTVNGSIPSGCPALVNEDTEIEILPFRPFLSPLPPLSELRRTLAIKRQVLNSRLEITLESLDMYNIEFRCFLVIGYAFDDQREWLKNKIGVMAYAHDDLGNSYSCVGFRFGETCWTRLGPQYSRITVTMVPAINELASHLTLVLSEITWSIREKKDTQYLDQVKHVIKHESTIVTVWHRQKAFHIIATGPWKFEIDLGQHSQSRSFPAIS